MNAPVADPSPIPVADMYPGNPYGTYGLEGADIWKWRRSSTEKVREEIANFNAGINDLGFIVSLPNDPEFDRRRLRAAPDYRRLCARHWLAVHELQRRGEGAAS